MKSDVKENTTEYYAARVKEYEQIYEKPERQTDLRVLQRDLPLIFAELDVLEIACGTGFWTEVLAARAQSMVATDINESVLELAQAKDYGTANVVFQTADAFNIDTVNGEFCAGFSGFWWSHVPLSRRTEFLHSFHGKLSTNSPVVFLDNRYVEGSSTPISRQDEQGNTYQNRKLLDGSQYEVIKNFPTKQSLQDVIEPVGRDLRITNLSYYWYVSYRTR